jgi:hypothetical protein
MIKLDFDATEGEHLYSIYWTSALATLSVDGKEIFNTTIVPTSPMNLFLSLWPCYNYGKNVHSLHYAPPLLSGCHMCSVAGYMTDLCNPAFTSASPMPEAKFSFMKYTALGEEEK